MQENGYYCGPAANRIALTSRGHYATQSYLAGQLGTTTNGTNSAADTTRVLNAVGQTGWYETKYIGGDSASDAQKALLKRDILLDIDNGYPLVTNIVGGRRERLWVVLDGHQPARGLGRGYSA